MVRVFISFNYARDGAGASNVLSLLNIEGAARREPVWLDGIVEASNDREDRIWDALREKLRDSDVLLCVVGEDTHNGDWIEQEVVLARNLGLGVVAVAGQGLRPGRPLFIRDDELVKWDAPEVSKAIDRAVARQLRELEERARAYLNGKRDEDVADLYRRLKAKQMFRLARRVIGNRRLYEEDPDGQLRQQEALCTSKDPDLPEQLKHDLALRLLGPLDTITDHETLGIAGGIWKRKWYFSAHRGDLDCARRMYQRGADDRRDVAYYCAINQALVLELLAAEDQEGAVALRLQADQIRTRIMVALQEVSDPTPWQYASLAEAAMALEEFEVARGALERFAPGRLSWELDTTARQLATILHLRQRSSWSDKPEVLKIARSVIARLGALGANNASSALAGRVGLGLSGGGFRASLYHLGVLERLADIDLLRRVEVLSCVSGGSIVGALYYIILKRELEDPQRAKPLSAKDYQRIVKETRQRLEVFVQTNPRTRVMSSVRANLRAAFSTKYSRSDRLAELMNEELYGPALGKAAGAPPFMHELRVRPSDSPAPDAVAFKPNRDNWRRQDKVPVLVLNATTLNTGHLWQFTAASMGEPPFAIPDVDMVQRLRRFNYRPDSPRHRVTVGHAVGASACVPGLFEPLTLAATYPDKEPFHEVRLVDGGVFDNQGTMSLLEQDVTFVIASDASGQIEFQPAAGGGIFSPLVRSNSVMMGRMRSAGYSELEYRRRIGQLRGVAFMHLRADLDVDPIDWADCEDPHELRDPARRRPDPGMVTRHGVRKDIQALLSSMRTDLDTFTVAEVEALRTAGYLQAKLALGHADLAELVSVDAAAAGQLPYETVMSSTQGGERLKILHDHLQTGSQMFGRLLSYRRRLLHASRVVCVLGLIIATHLIWTHRDVSLLSVGGAGMIVAGMTLTVLLGSTIKSLILARSTLDRWTVTAGASILTALVAKVYMLLAEPKVLAEGQAVSRRCAGEDGQDVAPGKSNA